MASESAAQRCEEAASLPWVQRSHMPFLASGTPSAVALASSWAELRQRVGDDPSGPLRHEAANAGLGDVSHLQRAITREVEAVEARVLDADICAHGTLEERRAWRQCDRSSTQWVSAWTSVDRGMRLEPQVFRVELGNVNFSVHC